MPASPGPSADIVETAADAQRSSRPPLLVLDRVRAFLDEHGLGAGALIDGDQRDVILRAGLGRDDR